MSDDRLATLYRGHVRFVWQLCRSLGVDAANVDDVTHDVFLVVRRRVSDRDPSVPLRAWLARVVRNVVLHHHRGAARRDARETTVGQPSALPPPPTPEDELGTREAVALMQRFIDGLNPHKREAFVLMEIQGMSAPEAAVALQANPATLYTRLRAARREFAIFVETLQESESRRSHHADA